MPTRHLTQIDRETGEQLEGTIVYVGAKHPSIYGGDWFMANREAYATLAKDPELTGRPLKVLLYLLSKLDYENWIQVPQKEIAEELGIHPASVSKEINLLLRKKILIRGPKVGQSYAFRLNPYYAWRGDSRKGREWIGQIIQGGKAGKTEDTRTE
jgi:hypothetical protein